MKKITLKMLALTLMVSLILTGCGNAEEHNEVVVPVQTQTPVPAVTYTPDVTLPTEKPVATDVPQVTDGPEETAPVVTSAPTQAPTAAPTEAPTKAPLTTAPPTAAPTEAPTKAPLTTAPPTVAPTEVPTQAPVVTAAPTAVPTEAPTQAPVVTEAPTPEPTAAPTEAPAPQPTPSYQVSQNIQPDERDDNEICATCNHQMVEAWFYYPTCDTHGYVNYVCQLCYFTDPEWSGEVPALGHTPEAYIAHIGNCVEPTTIRYRCSVCGDDGVLPEEYVPTENPEHDWYTGMGLVGFDPDTGDPIYEEMTQCTLCSMHK